MSTTTNIEGNTRITDIMTSYSGLPNWVKIWMNFILGPVNLATLAFLDEPNGLLISALALTGMALTVSIVIASRGFTKLAAAGHIVPWTPLIILAYTTTGGSELYQILLAILLVTNSISLAFDINDLRVWIKSRKLFRKRSS